jgi:hypothetical protein
MVQSSRVHDDLAHADELVGAAQEGLGHHGRQAGLPVRAVARAARRDEDVARLRRVLALRAMVPPA